MSEFNEFEQQGCQQGECNEPGVHRAQNFGVAKWINCHCQPPLCLGG